MNSLWPSSGKTQTFRYQHNLGWHLVSLFTDFKSNLLHLHAEEKLQTCLKKLVEFCKHVIANKDTLKDSVSRNKISKSLSAIKAASLQLSRLVKTWPPTLTASENSFENQIKLVDHTISAIQTILKTFYKHWNKKLEPSLSFTKDMEDLWNLLDKEEDTLGFEFDRSRLAYEDDKFFTAKHHNFIPLEGDFADSFDNTFSHKYVKPFEYSKASLAKHNSKFLLTRIPSNFSGESCVEMVNNGSELIETAHKVLLASQKAVYVSNNKNIDLGKLKRLRKKLNEAIINFDISTTSLIEDMENEYRAEDFLKDGSTLLKLVREVDSFMELNKKHVSEESKTKNKSPVYTSKSFGDIVKQPSDDSPIVTSPRSCKSDTSTNFSSNTLSPRSLSDYSGDVDYFEEDLRDLSKLSPGHPMNSVCFEGIAKRIIEAATTKNAMLFEREVNKITDCQDVMKMFIDDYRKRKELQVIVMPLMDKAIKTSRDFIRHCRKTHRQQSCSGEDLDNLKAISRYWCKNQVLFMDDMWKKLTPWTSLLEPVFAIKKFHASPTHLQNTLSNEWVHKFQELNEMLKDLSTQFQCMVLIDPVMAELHQEDPFIRASSRGLHQTESQIKVNNLMIEMKEYSSKVLQLTKLYLLGDISSHEWLSFGLWLFRWANTSHNILHQIDTSLPVYSGHALSMKRLTDEQQKWMEYGEHLKISSQDVSLVSSLEKSMKETTAKYEKFKQVFEHSTDTIDMKKARLIILLEKWKMKAQEFAICIQTGTNYLSKPINTLVKLAGNSDSISSLESTAFEAYEEIFMRKMERVRLHTCLAVDKASGRKSVHSIIELLDGLEETSDKLLNVCHKIQREPLTCVLVTSSFNLQLEWLSKGNRLLYLLRKLTDVKYPAVSAVMRHMLTDKDMSNPHEFIEVAQEENENEDAEQGCFDTWLPSYTNNNNNETEADSVYGTWDSLQDSLHNVKDETSHEDRRNIKDTTNQTGVEDAMRNWLYEETLKSPTQTMSAPPISPNIDQGIKKEKYKPPVSPKPKHYRKILEAKNRQQNEPVSRPQSTTDSEMFRPESRPKSLAAAARILQAEVDKWEEDNNSIIKVVKLMASQMAQMAHFEKGCGTLKTKNDFVATAKAIAANAKTVAKFATIVAQQCPDESCQQDLLHYAELIPTMSTQLRIVASVKSVNNNDETADAMLVINAGNLMKGVVGALKSAEAASVKISTMPTIQESQHDGHLCEDDVDVSNSNDDLRQSCDLAFQWKRKVRLKRAVDALCSPRDELGLRLSKETSLPSLTDLVLNSPNEM